VDLLKPFAHPGHIAEALCMVATVAHKKGDYKQAAARLTEGQALMRECGDALGEATALTSLARLHMAHGEYKAALRATSEAREYYEELDDDEGLASVLFMIADAQYQNLARGSRKIAPGTKAWNEGTDKALRAARESVSLAKEVGNQNIRASALYVMAEVEFLNQKYHECVDYSNESVMICRAEGEVANEAVALQMSADAYHELNMMDDAKAAASEALELCRFLGDRHGEHMASELLSKIEPKPDIDQMMQMMQMMQQQQGTQQGGQQAPAAGGNIPFQPKMMQQQEKQAPQAESVQRVAGNVLDTSKGISRDVVNAKVREIVVSLIGDDDDLEDDLPLMSAGLTSNSAVLLVDAIREEIPGIKVSPTLVFDYPSVADISSHLAGH